jgi:hypothetical protein
MWCGKWAMGVAGFGCLEAGVSEEHVAVMLLGNQTAMNCAFNSSGRTHIL